MATRKGASLASADRTARPRLLLVSMYPLDEGLWGPTVRITNLRRELGERVDLDVVSGYRGTRRGALARYAFSGRLRGLDGIYVESSTFLPSESDIAFLGLARALGIPVLTYIRDAYQLFPDLYPATTLRRRAGTLAFRPAIWALTKASSRLAYPSRGLARAVSGTDIDAVILPPGSPSPALVERNPDARRLLYVGNGRDAVQGAPLLLAAVQLARDRGASVDLTVVSRPGEAPPPPYPSWLRVMAAEGDEITALLSDVIATVIPRPRTAYNDLALPVKLFDYLAFGRPLLVTECTEQAAIVSAHDAGVVVGDGVTELAEGVMRIAASEPAQIDWWAGNATRAALENGWGRRSDAILEALDIHPSAEPTA